MFYVVQTLKGLRGLSFKGNPGAFQRALVSDSFTAVQIVRAGFQKVSEVSGNLRVFQNEFHGDSVSFRRLQKVPGSFRGP